MPRFTLFKKILVITLLLSLLPLFVSSAILLMNLQSISTKLTDEISRSDDRQATQSLQMKARDLAENIRDFLHQCESDLLFLSRSRLDRSTLLDFYQTRLSEVWQRGASATATQGTHEFRPIYRSIAIIDRNGMEQSAIRNGQLVPKEQLRNVADPANTEFKSEEYFRRVRALKPGEIYVSHLTGFHVSKQEQLAGAKDPESAYDGKGYQGGIRFGSPIYDSKGKFSGMVLLTLDHQHLMEFTQHIDPGKGFGTLFPSYQSGNYAFLFDDEGWIITHPKYWDIRGVDQTGRLVPPYTADSKQDDVDSGRIPFNLDHAGFIHKSYPTVSAAVRNRQEGFVDITNVGGAKKIMAYAPIFYDTGDYARHGVFGGVTIGFQVDQFHEASHKGSRLIDRQLGEHRRTSALIILATALVSALSAWLLSRGISIPLRQLTESAGKLAAGDSHVRVAVNSSDEIGVLANTFNYMADELDLRKQSILSTLDELRKSRLEILDERNFKESVLESISSGIVTFSPQGRLTSINRTGRLFLGEGLAAETHYTEVFKGWGVLNERISQVLSKQSGYGRETFRFDHGPGKTHFDVGFFPIGADAEQGLTVTLRNETQRENLQEEMMRLDRLASLGKLSAGIAHEVRNPLTGISLLLDDLHDQASSGPEDRDLIKKALAEIERVEKLINALLNYSSPVRADFRECDLNRLVCDTVLLMRRQCERQKVQLNLTEGEVPPLRLDPEKIKQAVLNIIKNAQEALPEGGRIEVVTSVQDGYAVIGIGDDGPGIASHDLPLIFEPFFTRKGAGTGLGLSITQRIVEEHHGKVRVETAPGGGTRFTIELPL
ncbi:sensor histidine kinase, Cache_1 and HAMP domain-containing [Citrifermentans bemidjiense Bem]|uniref:histidine kinase n=1 Tax=Citrifermentans bemidjiense (strain ATCC BAA-1014 / DSM 16622 / JCM 12645 / Bem) TaxID=404380 RepID=B5EHC9_CITBB|nr:PAS domain-containing sensor histidine kinase [Citrifermentans bemidjiense]ACH39665.1 sensor histidine kinase, Cache_1 and HAMP domain-containing [Citrifermentans bemidjiense Bem]